MNNEHQFYQTPIKPLQASEFKQTTKPVVQSRLYYNHQQQQAQNHQADQIQTSIRNIGDELKNLFNQMQSHTDKYSQEYLELQAQRKELKKKLIDLDFEHKMIFANRIRNQKNSEIEKEEGGEKNQQRQEIQTQQNKSKDTNQLVQSRRKLRIAELEAQLTQSKLRRSRIEELSNQLQYLRMSYSDPYLTYYSYPYYNYPSYYSRYYSRLWF